MEDKNTDINKKYNRMFQNFYNSRLNWYNRGIENEELVFADREQTGTQYKKEQLNKAQQEQAIPITVNLLSAIKEQIQALLTAYRPSMTAVPIGRSAKNFAYVWKELCSAGWYLNKVSRKLDIVIGDSITVGQGYLRVRPSNFYNQNDLNVIIEYVPWQYVYLDPASKDIGLEDHEAIFLAIPIPAEKAKRIYNLTDEEVQKAKATLGDEVTIPTQDSNLTDYETGSRELCWVQEIYEKVKVPVYFLGDGRQVLVKPPDDRQYVNTEGKMIDNKVVRTIQKVLIKHTIRVGNYVKYSKVLPITKYPIAKFGCKWNKHPYDYPILHDVIDLQKTFNTFLAITIVNAQVASNGGWVGAAGTVDKAQWSKDAATPGSFLEYEADPNLPNGGIPQQRQIQPLANAWYTLMMQVIKFIEYITGIYGVVQGNPNDAPNTLGATNSLQDLGTQRVKRFSRNISDSLNDLFDVYIECVQAYGDPNVVVNYVNNTDATIQIETGVKGQMEQQGFQENQMGPEEVTKIENLVTEEIKMIVGSPKVGQYKVRFQNTADLPTVRQQALAIIRELLAHLSDPDIAIAVTEQAMQLLDMPQTDEVLQKVDVIRKMKEQIQGLAQQVDNLTKENTKLQDEILKRTKELDLADFRTQLSDVKAKVEHEVNSKIKEDNQKENQTQKQTIY